MNTLLIQLLPLLIGPLAAGLTQLAKQAPAVPFQGSTATSLIVVLAALSTLLTLAVEVAIAYLSGNLAAYDWSRAVNLLVPAVTSVLTAAGAYGLAKKAGDQ